MKSDVEIANEATLSPIGEIAASLDIPAEHLVPYGHTKAKVDLGLLQGLTNPRGKLVLMTAMSPTPAGEGKTTTVVGLVDGLAREGAKVVACLREPSMGPVFGMKGGAAGGGYAQVVPMTDLNLHFTGDFAALTAAHNLLSALIDNHIHHGNQLDIDVRNVTWKRAIDLNDRALRQMTIGLGPAVNGYPREDGFEIVVASELMAIFCLTDSWSDLKRRIGDIVIGYTRGKEPVTARDLKAEGAMTVMLRDALSPNLVQTLEHTPAFVHGGPFGNIAHGCNSVIATKAGLSLADVVVTEAGFGADLGAEKFMDIKCRAAGLSPDLAVVVATVRSLKFHGDGDMEVGFSNLSRHLHNLREVFSRPVVVAINRFPDDTDEEIARLVELCAELGVDAFESTHVVNGGEGARRLARGVLKALETPAPPLTYAYDVTAPLDEKVTTIAQRLYGAAEVVWGSKAQKQLARIQAEGYDGLPVCVAKTQYSFSTDPKLLGAPSGHRIEVTNVRAFAGAGFVVVQCGDIMTMPGLPSKPASEHIDLTEDGVIVGLS